VQDPVIEIAGLVKSFGSHQALNGLDLDVSRGEVHAFLGPNGAGKTTTMRIVLGLTRQDAGHVRLFGAEPRRGVAKLHRRLAYVPGDVSLWPNLTGGEVIDLLGRLRGESIDAQRRAELLDAFDLDPRRKCRTYSKGNRQKVALVAALASRAELLLLDEPTSGLDPVMESVFQGLVKGVRLEGRSVLLSSHILSEVEALADRVTIIKEGRTVVAGPLSELRLLGHVTVEATLVDVPAHLKVPDEARDWVLQDGRFSCHAESEHVPLLVNWLGSVGVRAITTSEARLEDLFLQHYKSDAA